MSVVPFKPFHACMNSKAVTLLSCGGAVEADREWDEDDILAGAVNDAPEHDDDTVTESSEVLAVAAADPLAVELSPVLPSSITQQPVIKLTC